MTNLNILIADDHILMLEGIERIIISLYPFANIYKCFSCDETYDRIYVQKVRFDLIILDILMPSNIRGIKSGFDIGAKIRKDFPAIKIMVITSQSEKLQIYNTHLKINPEGFLVKSDFSSTQLYHSIQDIFLNKNCKSNLVQSAIRDVCSNHELMDNFNRQLLILLGQGILTKNLPDHLPLSLSAIDKRKAIIKQLLNVTGGDEELLQAAKARNLIQ